MTSQLEIQPNLSLSADVRQPCRDLRSPLAIRLRRGSLVKWLRVFAFISLDGVLLFLAQQFAETIAMRLIGNFNGQENSVTLITALAIQLGILAVAGLYDEGHQRRDYPKLVKSFTFANLLLLFIASINNQTQGVPQVNALSWLLGVGFIVVGRFLADSLITIVRQNGIACHPVFVLCKVEDADQLTSTLNREPHYMVRGWYDVERLNDKNRRTLIERISGLGVSEVFICSQLDVRSLMLLYWDLRNVGITLHLSFLIAKEDKAWQIPKLFSFTFCPPLFTGVDFWVKRSFDAVASVLFLLLMSPVYLVIMLLIRLDSPGPIFYKQVRVGLRNQPFKVWKFRTMVVNAAELQKELEALNETKDGVLFKMKDDPRITRVGKFLRRYSLDELPQVFNVLFGEMSFVGPRPLPLRDVEKFQESYFVRHEVLPGITGLWQVSGRSDIDSFEDVLNLDLTYIKNWSLWQDLRIILKTVQVVLQKTGAY